MELSYDAVWPFRDLIVPFAASVSPFSFSRRRLGLQTGALWDGLTPVLVATRTARLLLRPDTSFAFARR